MQQTLDCTQAFNSHEQATKQLKTKILKLQSYEQTYKHYAKQINYALTYPNEYQKYKIEQLIDYETLELNKFIKVFASLSPADQRPYLPEVEHYQQCIREHRELVELLSDEEQFIKRAQSSKQINQEQFADYLDSLSWKYLLRGLMILLGSFIIHLIIGASSRWNMLNIYITSFYKVTRQPYLIVAEDSYASPLSLFCMGLGMRLGLRLSQPLGPFPTCILSMLLAALAVYVSAYMPTFETYILFSFALFPLFSCLSFQLVLSECFKYYPKYRLLINGFLLMGTGLGHVLFGLLNNNCCNPQDIDNKNGFFGGDLDFIARQVPRCTKQTCYVVLFLGTLALALIYPAVAFNRQRKNEQRKNQSRLDFEHACASEKEALTSKIFWIMMLMIICTTSGNYFMITNFRNLVAKYFKHTFSLASILLGFNLGNALSRALWDFLFTKIGFKWCMIIIATLNATIMATMQLILQDENVYRIYFILGGLCLGGCMVCFLNFVGLVFGEYVGEQLPGYIWTGYSLANLLQYFTFNSYDLSRLGFLPSCLVLSGLNVVSLVVIFRTKLQGNWENSLNLLELKCCFK